MTLLQSQYRKKVISVDPQEIEHIEFRTTRLKPGYDPDEVDNFLDRVAIQMRSMNTVIEQQREREVSLKRELAEANRKLTAWGEAPTSVIAASPATEPEKASILLQAAQKTADEAIARANADALAIQHRADEAAQKSVAEAQKTAGDLVNAARGEVYTLEQRVAQLKSAHAKLRTFLKEHLENSIADLEEYNA